MTPKRGRKQQNPDNRKEKRQKTSHQDSDEQISDDIKYLLAIEIKLKSPFESEEDKDIFVNNVLKQIHDKLWDTACDKIGSRVLEKLILLADIDNIQKLIEVFKTNFRKACIHLSASHVTEKLTQRIYQLILKTEREKDADEDVKDKTLILIEWINNLASFMLNNLTDFMCENHASHIIQDLLKLISNLPPYEEKHEYGETELFKIIVQNYVETIMKWKNLQDFLTDVSATGVLQTLTMAITKQNSGLSSKFIKFVFEQGLSLDPDEKYPSLNSFFTLRTSSLIVEKLITCSSEKTIGKIIKKHLKNQISDMVKHPIANFVIQKLTSSCKTPEQFELIMDEIEDVMGDILECKHYGILVTLSQACVQHKTQQTRFMMALENTFSCAESGENQFFPSLATMKKLESSDIKDLNTYPIVIQGSLIIQQLFSFNRPAKIVDSLLSMQPTYLTHVACDKSGSHIFDAFVKSQLVGAKNKSKLVKALQGQFADIACNTYGSRCLENIWENLDLNDKVIIATELKAVSSKLKTDNFGRYAFQKFGINNFTYKPEEWKSIQKNQIKNKKLFKEILAK